MSKFFFFCLAVSLAAHLALLFCWPVGNGQSDGQQAVAVLLLPPSDSLLAGKSLVTTPATTSRPSIATTAPSLNKVPPPDTSAVFRPEGQPILAVESASVSADPATAQEPSDVTSSVQVSSADGDPQMGDTSESLLRATVPLYAVNPKPTYPRLAEKRGWEGETLLRVRVAAAGTVLNAEVEHSSGYSILDRAALKAVATWQFQPARRGALAVESTVLIPIPFILQRN